MGKKPFRFGLMVEGAESRAEWVARARKAEDLGYATFLAADHVFPFQLAPVPALATVAEATTRLRISSFLFANDFRNPALLAREAATLDLLCDGRFELGIGAGWRLEDFTQLGIPFDRPGVRIRRLEEALQVIKPLLAGETVTHCGTYYTVTGLQGHPLPVQKPRPPIHIGGGARRILSLAAREADIVGIMPKTRTDGRGADVFDAQVPAAEKIGWIREAAGERFDELELSVMVLTAAVTDDRADTLAKISARSYIPEAKLLDMPYMLVGNVDQIVEDLQRRREQHGISYITVPEGHMEVLAPVVARLAGT